MYKGAIRRDLTDELVAAGIEIIRAEARRRNAQKALDEIEASGEQYVGEHEDQRERREQMKAAFIKYFLLYATKPIEEEVAAST